MDQLSPADFPQLFDALGDVLADDGVELGLVIVGGAALILQQIVARATRDVDVIALTESADRNRPLRLRPPDPMPEPLLRAIRRVARDFGLDPEWMNPAVGAQWKTGLPPGLETRVRWRRFGGLHVGVAGRFDLLCLKLYAAADDTGPASRHVQDLLALRPSPPELDEAAAWIRTQDSSPGFLRSLAGAMDYVRRHTR